ncbi:tetratricopeptide (TPR) repeat protein [Pontibacter aydingkolensis]|uniref:SH3 domain-containing protein n=1 Tax=Pontibacter aydingkolensis TaxID=1911536 RepID=A0ABS7CT23_9BACT|nr:SH3 domain-containing protein [Pontibacter aydingkolensis]MBW7466846.1 SH3 domain-containing protein [Pontibacter aydingkolensis]
MKYSAQILTLLLGLLPISKAYMQPLEKIYKDAVGETEKGNYNDAIILFESVLTSGSESAALYNNLAYCYYANNKFGLAILNFEKAALVDPANQDVQKNLMSVRQTLGLTQKSISGNPAHIMLQHYTYFLSLDQLMFICTALLVVSLLLFSINFYVPNNVLRYAGTVLLIGSLSTLFVVYFQIVVRNSSTKAVVITGPADVRSAASNNAKVINSITEGETVLLLDSFEGWYKVELSPGNKGWVAKDALEIIKSL